MTNIHKTFNAPMSAGEHFLRELSLAAEFQQAVLPNIISTDYLDIALHYQPFDMVSGDVYDFKLNREKELAMFVGDATGHGISAALMTMMVHIAIDSLTPNLSTDESIRKLNKLISMRDTHRFVTGVFFRIAPNGKLTVTHAGHPSIIILPNNDAPFTFDSAGCPLGLFEYEPVRYIEQTYQLKKGDQIIAYTDGLTDQQNPTGTTYGEEGLLKLISNNKFESSQACLELIKQDIDKYSNNKNVRDDTTLIVVTYH